MKGFSLLGVCKSIQIIVCLLHFNYTFSLRLFFFFNFAVFFLISPKITAKLNMPVWQCDITCDNYMPDFFLFQFMVLCSLGGFLSLSFSTPFVFQCLENWPFLLEMRILSAQKEQCFVTQWTCCFPLCSALVALPSAKSKLNGLYIHIPSWIFYTC